jgi:C4-dicarboxylate transporter, DctM subunit
MLATIFILSFLFCLIIGVPISLALAIPTVIYFYWVDISLQMIPARMFAGLDTFLMLAIPFFMFAGRVMNDAGITERIVAFSKAITGATRGGLAKVNVVANMFMAGISGSATADAAAIGSILIPAMKKDGYSDVYSVAVTAISSIIGPIIPPSIVFILYGALTGTSVIALFLAGIVPGIMLGLSFIVVIHLQGKRLNFPVGEPTSLRLFGKTMIQSAFSMAVPLVILGGLLGGVFTPTESGAIASFLAMFAGFVLYRQLKGRHMWGILQSSALDTANVMILVATSTVFSWVLAAENIPTATAKLLLAISHNPYVLLLFINVLLLFLGTFMDTFPAMIITTPVLLPAVKQLGVDPLHFGIIMTINLMIGAVTPPVGLCIYIASSIGKTTVEAAAWAMRWLFLASIVVLLAVTYIPWFSMSVPRLFGY